MDLSDLSVRVRTCQSQIRRREPHPQVCPACYSRKEKGLCMGPHWAQRHQVTIPPKWDHNTDERGRRHEGPYGRRTCSLYETSLRHSGSIIRGRHAIGGSRIEDRVARSVIRAVSIDEIMNDATLIRSDISRFSRGRSRIDS